MLLMHGLPGLRPRHTWPEYSAYRRLGTTQSSLVLACNDLPSTLQLTRRCCHFAPDLPLISARQLAREGLLAPAAVPVLESLREHNPLLFDFVLKRQLRAGSARFADPVFETRPFFERTPA